MKRIVLAAAIIALLGTVAAAEEQFGMKVYPQAKQDATTGKFCSRLSEETEKMALESFKTTIKTTAVCYRTNADFKTVVEFYSKHPKLKLIGQVKDKGPMKNAVFCRNGFECASLGSGVDVMLNSPWGITATDQNDLVIVIRKSEKKK